MFRKESGKIIEKEVFPMFKIMKTVFLFLLVSCFTSQDLFGVPAQVMIVRHGEKPANREITSLNKKGAERAAALAPYFLGTQALLKYGPPVAVYAMNVGRVHGRSLRPIETCISTAEALGLPLSLNYKHDDYEEMTQEILKDPELDGKNVLICWEHFNIPNIAQGLGVKNAPASWPSNVFDRTWVIQFNKDGTIQSFQNLPQQLLYGDSSE